MRHHAHHPQPCHPPPPTTHLMYQNDQFSPLLIGTLSTHPTTSTEWLITLHGSPQLRTLHGGAPGRAGRANVSGIAEAGKLGTLKARDDVWTGARASLGHSKAPIKLSPLLQALSRTVGPHHPAAKPCHAVASSAMTVGLLRTDLASDDVSAGT